MSNISETSPLETRAGGCLCGAVRYAVSGSPINLRACHCKDCQRITGSAFFIRGIYPKAAVIITGALAEFEWGDDLIRRFCPRCGSQIFAGRKSRPDAIAIALGTLDNTDGLRPADHIWVSDKQEWLSLPHEIPQYPEGAMIAPTTGRS